MSDTPRPKLRPVELFPLGVGHESQIVFRDPEGYGETVLLPLGAALLAALMDGRSTFSELRQEFFVQTGTKASEAEIAEVVRRLDEAYLLESERFASYRRDQNDHYLNSSVRQAAHAGESYSDDPEELRQQLDDCFTCDDGPGRLDTTDGIDGQRLRGVLSPHIDITRGGSVYAWSYKQIAEHSPASLFVILGTAHNPMQELFTVTRKDFATPLGTVKTDGVFIDRLVGHLHSSVAGQLIDPFADDLAHRFEHSIEFQTLFLQYTLGKRRDFQIVPILVGSFYEFIDEAIAPDEVPEVQAFVAALRAASDAYPGEVCFISASDFAHIGPRFGDEQILDDTRLTAQAVDDRRLLEHACQGDAGAFFRHVARQNDCNRICGLSPTYTMLEALEFDHADLLKYAQATESDGSSCVSFASIGFYGR